MARGVGVRAGGRWILQNVDLNVFGGELLSLVGPNGAGKSTLLSVLSGDRRRHEGTVCLHGRDVHSYRVRELAKERSVLLQRPHMQFAFTIEEVVRFGLYARAKERTPREENRLVAEVLGVVGLSEKAGQSFFSLSGGEQALASFARVLVQGAPVLLLDEPTASLDICHQERLLKLARQHVEEGGTVVVVLHDLNVAAAYSNRVLLLRDGHVAGVGTPTEVLQSELLSEVYAHPILVKEHPTRACPLVVSV